MAGRRSRTTIIHSNPASYQWRPWDQNLCWDRRSQVVAHDHRCRHLRRRGYRLKTKSWKWLTTVTSACAFVSTSRARASRIRLAVWQNHLRKGSVARINLSDSRRSENTINTHKYNTIYWSSSRSYYNLGSRISYIEEVWSQNYASKDKSKFVEVIFLNGQNILFALKENVIHRYSKPENPNTESNPHWFGFPTDNPHRHRR
jgi:hypothetical protein